MADSTVRSGAKDRSPNYPSVGLPTAIEAAKKLWLTERRTTVPPAVAAKALGYNSLSGASRAILAALRQYGLIDVAPAGVTVSKLAVEIAAHDEGTGEWIEAIRSAASAPDIFREIVEAQGQGSDSAISAYLITRKGFSPEGAKRFVRAFRETRELVNRADQGYHRAQESGYTEHGDPMTEPQLHAAGQTIVNPAITTMQFLLGGGVRAEVRFIGGEPQPSHIATLEAYLKIASDALKPPA